MNTTANRLGALVCALAAICLLSGAALAADPAAKPDGFRGIAWGTAVSGLKDLVLVETDGDFTDYDRKGDKMDLGGMPVEMVTYGFYKGQFYHAAIAYAGTTGFDAIQEQLVAKYGKPDVLTERTDDAGRRYALAAWNWPGYAYIGHRRYVDGSAGRVFYFYSPLVEASKAQAASSVATAAMSPEAPGAGAGSAGRPGAEQAALARLREKPAAPAALEQEPAVPASRVRTAETSPPPAAKSAGSEPAAPAGGTTHVVAKGDMLSSLAKRYGVTSQAIEAANPGVTPKNLKLGQTLRIPAQGQTAPAAPARPEPVAAPEPEKAPAAPAEPAVPEPKASAPAKPEPVVAPEPEKVKPAPAKAAETAETPRPEPAAPETKTAPAKAAAPGSHVIAQGDMISSLAKRYGVSEKEILKANPGLKPGNLKLGQVIRLPHGATTGSGEMAASESKPQAKSEPTIEPTGVSKPESKAEVKDAPKPEPTPEPKAEVKDAPKPEPTPEPKAEVKDAPKHGGKAEPASPAGSKPGPDAASAGTSDAASKTAPGVTSAAMPEAGSKAPGAGPRMHVLEFEDTLSGLAKRYGVTTAAILKANPGLDPKKLKPGRKITIP